MNAKKCYALFVPLCLFYVVFFTSCTHLGNPLATAPNIHIENLIEDAYKLYHQGHFNEAAQKFELASKVIPKDPPTWSATIFYSILGLFQEKSGDTTKSSTTFEEVKKLLAGLKGTLPESEIEAKRFMNYGRRLKGQDQIWLLQKLAPLARSSQGKAGEAFFIILVSEVYIGLNNYQEAYVQATEALKLSKDVGDLYLEVFAILNVSGSLVTLGKAEEAVPLLQTALDKVGTNSKLKANILAQLGLAHAALGFEYLTKKEFQEAVNLASSIEDRELVARFHWKYGLAFFFLNKPNEGIKQLTEAARIFEQLKDELTVATLEGGIAYDYFLTGALEDAKGHASRAADLWRKLGNRIEEARNLRIEGQSLAALGKIDDALKVFEKAALIQVDEKDRDGVLETLWSAVVALKSAGRIEDTRQVLLMGLNTHTSVFRDDREGEIRIRLELARVCNELGHFSEALEQFSRVVFLYEKLADIRGRILTLLELAQTYAKLDDQENRVGALDLAEKLGAEVDDPDVKVMILSHTADFFAEEGNPVEALQRYSESLKISRSISKQAEMIQLGFLGIFYRRIGEHAKALEYFEEELKIAKEIGDQTKIPSCLNSLAFCYLFFKKYDDAIRLAREAIGMIRTTKRPIAQNLDELLALSAIGLALVYQGKYEDALKVTQERLQIAEKSGKPIDIKNACNDIGYIYLAMRKYNEATENFKKAIKIIEFLRGSVWDEEHKMRFLSRQLSPYEGIIHAFFELHRKNDSKESQLAEEALSFAERNKGRIWAEQLSKSRAESIQEAVPLEIRNEEKDLLNKFISAVQEYEKASTRLGISARQLEEKEKASAMAFEKYRGFMEEIRRRYPRYALIRYYVYQPLQFNELTAKDDETLILYKVTGDWVYAWVVRRIGGQNRILKFTRSPNKPLEIAITIDKLLLPFRKGKYEDFDAKVSNKLFDKILKPVLEGVDVTKRLIIIPDGMLNLIPFEVLVTGTGCDNGVKDNCFLGDQFIINYYPSAAILTFNREAIPPSLPPRGSLFAVGDPIYGAEDERLDQTQISLLVESERKQESNLILRSSRIQKRAQDQGYGFKRLKHTGVEVHKILGTLRNSPGNKEVLVGFDASEDRIKSRDLSQYRYLHFAVHGVLAYDVPLLKEPALVLCIYPLESKEDGFLTVSEIYGFKLNADLVTLSACETALGPRVEGEGVVGLGRAFITAGARAVLVSLWEVPDESTALLMEDFYRRLSQGIDKLEALRQAKEYLRTRGYKNPYFWAPFILIGD